MEPQEEILELMYSFRQVHLTFYQVLWKDADALGTTWLQFITLRTLWEHPGIGLTELAELIHVGNSTTSGVVDRLVKAGMVLRERSDKDRRSIQLRVTEKGVELRQRTEQLSLSYLVPLLKIKHEDREHLLKTHKQIVDNLLELKGREKIQL